MSLGFEELDWLTKSHDLNLTEHIWDEKVWKLQTSAYGANSMSNLMLNRSNGHKLHKILCKEELKMSLLVWWSDVVNYFCLCREWPLQLVLEASSASWFQSRVFYHHLRSRPQHSWTLPLRTVGLIQTKGDNIPFTGCRSWLKSWRCSSLSAWLESKKGGL